MQFAEFSEELGGCSPLTSVGLVVVHFDIAKSLFACLMMEMSSALLF